MTWLWPASSPSSQEQHTDQNRCYRQRSADPEIRTESDPKVLTSSLLDDDQVRNRTYDREIPRERRGHRERKPCLSCIWQMHHERFEQEHRWNITHDIREHSGYRAHHADSFEMECVDPVQNVRLDHALLKCRDDYK